MIYKFKGLDSYDGQNQMEERFSFNVRNDIHMMCVYGNMIVFHFQGKTIRAVFEDRKHRDEAFEELDMLLSFHPSVHPEQHI